MTLELCPNNYCGNNKNLIDGDCHDLDYQAGNKIVIQKDGMPRCYCVCSCLAVDTPIGAPGGPIKVQDIVADQTKIYAAGRDMKFTEYLVTQASKSAPGVTEHTIYLHYALSDKTEQELVVSRDHVFILSTGELIRADMLQLTDQLVDAQANPVQLLEILWGSYDGIFYEFATKMEPPDANLTGHLVLTNGVVSGDFAVQAFVNMTVPAHSPSAARTTALNVAPPRPVVGSAEWRVLHAPATTPAEPKQVNSGEFIHAPAKKIEVPAHASSFLPPLQAAFLELFAPKRDYNDPYYEQMGQYLETFFSAWYPDVNYQFDWYSDEVNAHSWVATDGAKNVLLVGGLLRIVGFDFEGVALAIAHELGHLYGEPDGSNHGVTCEGEADYWGAKIVLRKVWFGEYYLDNTTKAIEQIKTLFGYLLFGKAADRPPTTENDRRGNAYPSISCRLDTYKAALALDPKPACADCEIVKA